MSSKVENPKKAPDRCLNHNVMIINEIKFVIDSHQKIRTLGYTGGKTV